MTETTVTTDKVALQERREQLAERLGELHEQQLAITEDVAICEQDWADAVELGEDAGLLAQRVGHRRTELGDVRRAADHLSAVLAGVDAELAEIEQNQQLDAELADYAESLERYRVSLDALPGAPAAAADAVAGAVSALRRRIDAARTDYDALSAQAATLRLRADSAGRTDVVADPPDWSALLEPTERGTHPLWILYLTLAQNRSDKDLLEALWSLARVSP